MAGLFTNGIEKIEFSEIGANGAMGKSFAALGFTQEDSFKIIQEEGQKTELKAEESESPVYVTETAGSLGFEFNLMNPDAEALKKIFGGEADAGSYTPPSTTVNIEKSFKVTPKQGFGIEAPRVKVSGQFTPDYGRNFLMMVKITVKVLEPTDGSSKRFKLVKKAG